MPTVGLWFLAAFVMTIPSDNGVTLPVVGSLSRLVGMLAFAVGVVALYRGGKLHLRQPALLLLFALAYLFWGASSYFWSIAPAATLGDIITVSQLVVVTWLVFQFDRTRSDSAVLMQAFVLGCAVTVGVAIATFLTSSEPTFREVGNFNPNDFAIVTALGVPLAWYLTFYWRSGWLYWANSFYPVLALVGIVLSASRGGMLTLLVAVSVIPLTLPRLTPLRRIALLTMIGLGSWGAFVQAPELYPELYRNIERLSSTTDELSEGSFTGRGAIWAAGLEIFSSSPLVGVGLGTFPRAVEPFIGRAMSAHNAWLAVASTTGLIGLLLYVGMMLVALTSALRSDRDKRTFLLVLFAALMVGMMPSNSEDEKFSWFLLALIGAQQPIVIAKGMGSATRRPAEGRQALEATRR